jgi:hypothetical protein
MFRREPEFPAPVWYVTNDEDAIIEKDQLVVCQSVLERLPLSKIPEMTPIDAELYDLSVLSPLERFVAVSVPVHYRDLVLVGLLRVMYTGPG